jgi:hypothetical protein
MIEANAVRAVSATSLYAAPNVAPSSPPHIDASPAIRPASRLTPTVAISPPDWRSDFRLTENPFHGTPPQFVSILVASVDGSLH